MYSSRFMTDQFAGMVILIASAAFGGIVIEEKSHRKMVVVGDQLILTYAGGTPTYIPLLALR